IGFVSWVLVERANEGLVKNRFLRWVAWICPMLTALIAILWAVNPNLLWMIQLPIRSLADAYYAGEWLSTDTLVQFVFFCLVWGTAVLVTAFLTRMGVEFLLSKVGLQRDTLPARLVHLGR